SGLQEILHGDDGHQCPFLVRVAVAPTRPRWRPADVPATATSAVRRVGFRNGPMVARPGTAPDRRAARTRPRPARPSAGAGRPAPRHAGTAARAAPPGRRTRGRR